METNEEVLRKLNYSLVKELGLFQKRAGLTFSQRHTLFHIKNSGSLSIQELAEILHLDASTMSRNVKKLIDSGLIEIFNDECDKRRKFITLTKAGEVILKETTDSIDRMLRGALQSLSAEETGLIIKAIQMYIDALSHK